MGDMSLEPYSPEFGRSWATEKETPTVPVKFKVIHQVVMVEVSPSRGDVYPDREVTTVLASSSREVQRANVADEIAKVTR